MLVAGVITGAALRSDDDSEPTAGVAADSGADDRGTSDPGASDPGTSESGAAPSCPAVATGPVSVAVSSDLAPALDSLVADSGCEGIELRATRSADVAEALLAGGEVPQVWVPDSRLWLGRVRAQAGDGAPAVTREVVSLASTPVVVASAATTESAGLTWREVLAEPGLKVGDPTSNTPALVPLLGARIEARAEGLDAESLAEELEPIATRVVARPPGTRLPTAAERVEAALSSGGLAAVSEQAATTSSFEVGSELALDVPSEGTTVLDFPVAVTAAPDRLEPATAVAAWLGELAASAEGVAVLTDAGFRDAAGAGPGEDTVPVERLGADAAVALEALDAYQTALAAASAS